MITLNVNEMWFYLVLGGTVLYSFVAILTKKALDRLNSSIVMWFTVLLATPFIAFYALYNGIPQVNLKFFIAVGFAVLFFFYNF